MAKIHSEDYRRDLGNYGVVKRNGERFVVTDSGDVAQAKYATVDSRKKALEMLKSKVLVDDKVKAASEKIAGIKDRISGFDADISTRLKEGANGKQGLNNELVAAQKELKQARRNAIHGASDELQAFRSAHKDVANVRANSRLAQAEEIHKLVKEAPVLEKVAQSGRYNNLTREATKLEKAAESFKPSKKLLSQISSGATSSGIASSAGNWLSKNPGKSTALGVAAGIGGYALYKALTENKSSQDQASFVEAELQRRAAAYGVQNGRV